MTYRAGDAVFRREVFATAVDQVMVVRLTCDRPGRISFSASLGREQDGRVEAAAPDRVVLRGEAISRDARHPDEDKVGVRFVAILQSIAEGGQIRAEGDRVEVRAPTRRPSCWPPRPTSGHRDPAAAAEAALAGARRSYEQLVERQVRDHRALFGRVEMELAGAIDVAGDLADRPTDERLDRLRRGEADPGALPRSTSSSADTC